MTALTSFLTEVFCVDDVSTVKDLNSIFDVEKSCLDYRKLFIHPRTQLATLFVHMFRDTFGYFPSHPYVVQTLANVDAWDYIQVARKLTDTTFLRYARPDTPLGKAIEKAKYNVTSNFHAFLNNPSDTKALIWKWLSRACPEHTLSTDQTLFSGFTKHLVQHRLATPNVSVNAVSEVSSELLSWTDKYVHCPYDYDRITYYITHNMNLYRKAFGKVMIHVTDESIAPDHIAKIIAAVQDLSPDQGVFLHAPPAIINAVGAITNTQSIPIIKPTIIFTNTAMLCFHIKKDTTLPTPQLGYSPIKTIILASQDTMPLAPRKDTIIAITDPSNAKSIASALLPEPCLPLFTTQPLVNAYLKMRLELDQKDIPFHVTGRASLYAAALPFSTYIPDIPRALESANITSTTKHAIMIIDTRPNPLSLLALAATISNLDHSSTKWEVVIGTSATAQEFYKTYIPSAKFYTTPEFDHSRFDIDAYNNTLKSPALWQFLSQNKYEKVLIIQDDGFLVRKGLESTPFFITHTYTGAPWLACAENEEVNKLTNGRMVGNGGFSLRDVSDMLNIATTHASQANTLFNNNLQPIQEDVFFSKFARSTPPSTGAASPFSTEQVFNASSLGFHKLWMYHPPERTLEFARAMIR